MCASWLRYGLYNDIWFVLFFTFNPYEFRLKTDFTSLLAFFVNQINIVSNFALKRRQFVIRNLFTLTEEVLTSRILVICFQLQKFITISAILNVFKGKFFVPFGILSLIILNRSSFFAILICKFYKGVLFSKQVTILKELSV